MKHYRLRPAAARELRDYTNHLLAVAGQETAMRFVAMARTSFENLGESPGLGVLVPSQNPRFTGLRKGRVKGFPKVLIFYLPLSSGIRVLNLIHAKHDWWAHFDVD